MFVVSGFNMALGCFNLFVVLTFLNNQSLRLVKVADLQLSTIRNQLDELDGRIWSTVKLKARHKKNREFCRRIIKINMDRVRQAPDHYLRGRSAIDEGRKEGRVYYCGGPTKEQAGTVPTYNASLLYATVVNCLIAVEVHLHVANRHLTRKLGRRVGLVSYPGILKATGK
jgi:hypothetical protein